MPLQAPFIAAALLASLTLSAAAVAHENHDHRPLTAPSAVTSPTPVDVAARFELRVNAQKTDWYLWRQGNTIETANVLAGQSNLWQRQGPQDYSYRRVFHKDRRVVEYTPGELKTRNAVPDWEKLGSVISPHLLEDLKRGATKKIFGQKAVHYVGRVGGQTVDLWWLEAARLPASLAMAGNGQRMAMKLAELHAVSPVNWPRVDENGIADYGLIDAADFGDMESDPFVARVMQQDGHSHSH